MHVRRHVVIEDSLRWGKVDRDEIAMHGSHVTDASRGLAAMTSIVNSTVVSPFMGITAALNNSNPCISIFIDEGTIFAVVFFVLCFFVVPSVTELIMEIEKLQMHFML